jgi:hypothetical protein
VSLLLSSDRAIYFYLPHRGGDAGLPQQLDDYWPWICRHRNLGEGRYSWTLQTCLQLKAAGLPVELVTQFPRRGVVVSHRDFLPLYMRPRAGVFLVCIKPDRKEHPWAHQYVVQNPNDRIFDGRNRSRATVIPLWSQPSLVRRRPDRGSRVETAAYFGRALNLAAPLKTAAFAETLAVLGVSWVPHVEMDRWHDYGAIDVIVAVRNFETEAVYDPKLDPDSKPPTKLLNAWMAGVPAIVGRESAFQHVRRGPLDAIEVSTVAELTDAIRDLRNRPQLYDAMVANGTVRAQEFGPEALVASWRAFFTGAMAEAHDAWARQGAFRRQIDNIVRATRFFADRQNLVGISGAKRRATARGNGGQGGKRS